jgi:hypothetical protein
MATVLPCVRRLARVVLKEFKGGYQVILIATIIIYSNHAACAYFWINYVIATVWYNETKWTTVGPTGKLAVVEGECCAERTLPHRVFCPTVWVKTFQYCKFWNVLFPPFVKKTASLQASPSEVIFPNKRTTYLRTTTCHYNREDIWSLKWKWSTVDLYSWDLRSCGV